MTDKNDDTMYYTNPVTGLREKIPRPRNSYMIFSSETHPTLPRLPTAIRAKRVAAMWHASSPEFRAQYAQRAEVEKAEHKLKYPKWIYQPQTKGQNGKSAEELEEKRSKKAKAKRDMPKNAFGDALDAPPMASLPFLMVPSHYDDNVFVSTACSPDGDQPATHVDLETSFTVDDVINNLAPVYYDWINNGRSDEEFEALLRKELQSSQTTAENLSGDFNNNGGFVETEHGPSIYNMHDYNAIESANVADGGPLNAAHVQAPSSAPGLSREFTVSSWFNFELAGY